MVDPGTFLGRMVRMVASVKVTGQDNLNALDAGGPALIVVNHTTVVDVIVVIGTLHNMGYTTDRPCEGVCTHRRHIRPIGTSDMWNYPVSKQVCEGSGIIPVDQHDGRAAYRAGLDALRNGEVVLIYPEGDVKVNEDMSPRQWRPGAARLAKSGHISVIPIAHHNSRKLGRGSYAMSILMSFTGVFRRPRICLAIGQPVLATELDSKSVIESQDYLYEALRETWSSLAQGK